MGRVERAERVILLLAGCVSAAALLFVAWLGTYSRFIADDYCTAAAARKTGVLSYVAHAYGTLSGRFASNVVLAATMRLGGSVAHIVPILALIAIVASSLFAVRRLTNLNWPASTGIALTFSWALLGCSPDVFQSVFWTTGVITYTLPFALVLLWAGIALRDEGNHFAHILLFIAGGFSETMTLVLFGGLVALFIATKRRAVIGGILVLAFAAIVMIAAPGNRVAFGSIQEATADAVVFLSIEGVTAGLALLLVFTVTAIVSPRLVTNHLLLAIAFVLWSLAMPFLFARVQLRALQTSHAAFVIAAAVAGWAVGQRPRIAMMVLTVLLLIPVALQMRHFVTMSEPASGFAREWDSIDEQLSTMRGVKGTVMVRAPQSIGMLAYINASPKHWANRCIADYYGLEQIASPEDEQ